MQSKLQSNVIFSKSLFICNFFFDRDLEQSTLELFIKTNYELHRYMSIIVF